MIINPLSVPVYISAVLICSLAIVIYFGSNKLSSRAFAVAIGFAGLWAIALALFLSSQDYDLNLALTKYLFFIGQPISAALVFACLAFPEDRVPSVKIQVAIFAVSGVAGWISMTGNSIVAGLIPPIAPGGIWIWQTGPLIWLWSILVYGGYIVGMSILYRKYRKAKSDNDVDASQNLKYMMASFVIAVVTSGIFNNLLPKLGHYEYAWLGGMLGIVWVAVLSYAVVRYQQMDTRIVLTEVFVLGMILAAFINIFLYELLGIWGRLIIFIAFIALGLFMIRGVLREAEQREELKDLNEHLADKVAEQTKEIRKSYEVEKKARVELEKLDESKNQFIMITQHHLRTPVTSLKWQIEAIQGDGYGPLAPDLKKAVGEMGEAVDRLAMMINEFLSISAWKAGTEMLSKSRISLMPIITDVIHELHNDITEKKLTVDIAPKHGWGELWIDPNKMREVVLIVMENAVRYNIPGGSIAVKGCAKGGHFELSVENTGITLTPRDSEKIFNEVFYRSDEAKKAHPIGMGIGLSMVKAVIEAHGGTISISPRGQNGGARVAMILPID